MNECRYRESWRVVVPGDEPVTLGKATITVIGNEVGDDGNRYLTLVGDPEAIQRTAFSLGSCAVRVVAEQNQESGQ